MFTTITKHLKKGYLPFLIVSQFLLGLLPKNLPVWAQITPDGTLPTQVTQSRQIIEITGGAEAGSNLFHSFQEFSVPSNSTAYFNNTSNIANIISRVTGISTSNIDGILKANGAASLFLINPNGIIFGTNSQLQLGGSFIASTANGIKFADGTEFRVNDPQTSPLLTISVPVGLQFGDNPGVIVNRSQGPEGVTNTLGDPVGLQVQSGNTLALVGGNIVQKGGGITALGGRVELGSVAGNNLVSLIPVTQGWILEYQDVQNFQDIELSENSNIDTSGSQGNIALQGRRVQLTHGSQIFNLTLGAEDGGNLTINASESVELNDVGSALLTQVGFNPEIPVTGEGGNLNIDTKQLILRDGAIISTGTISEGKAGNLVIDASELVEIVGSDVIFIPITGTINFIPSILTTSTQGTGEAGNLLINTRRLTIRDGARVQASTFSDAQGGNVKVNASELVEVRGTALSPTGNFLPSSLSASSGGENFPIQGTGKGGNLDITTEKLTVTDGAEISVSGLSLGDAGDIILNSDSTWLDRQGGIIAQTASGEGGNITLQGSSLLILRRNSEISTTAGGGGNGGNITIDSNIVALLESSKIAANAFAGNGGNVTIRTQGLFVSPDSQITASSQLGIDGVVEIVTSDPNAQKKLVELATNTLEAEEGLKQGCGTGGKLTQGEFYITGKNGQPPELEDDIEVNVLVDWGTPSSVRDGKIGEMRETGETGEIGETLAQPIMEAQGWMRDANGKVVLTAQASNVTPNNSGMPSHSCNGSQNGTATSLPSISNAASGDDPNQQY